MRFLKPIIYRYILGIHYLFVVRSISDSRPHASHRSRVLHFGCFSKGMSLDALPIYVQKGSSRKVGERGRGQGEIRRELFNSELGFK